MERLPSGAGLWFAGPAFAEPAERRPPGIGRTTVRSVLSGSEKGLSLMPPPVTHRLAADCPQLHLQAREIPRHMDGKPTRCLHLLPMRAVAIQLEVSRSRVERNLPRRDRQRAHRNAREQNIDQVANVLYCADFHLTGK